MKTKSNHLDFVRMGIAKRKLTRKEAKQITKEIMAMKLKPKDRVIFATIKALQVVNH